MNEEKREKHQVQSVTGKPTPHVADTHLPFIKRVEKIDREQDDEHNPQNQRQLERQC